MKRFQSDRIPVSTLPFKKKQRTKKTRHALRKAVLDDFDSLSSQMSPLSTSKVLSLSRDDERVSSALHEDKVLQGQSQCSKVKSVPPSLNRHHPRQVPKRPCGGPSHDFLTQNYVRKSTTSEEYDDTEKCFRGKNNTSIDCEEHSSSSLLPTPTSLPVGSQVSADPENEFYDDSRDDNEDSIFQNDEGVRNDDHGKKHDDEDDNEAEEEDDDNDDNDACYSFHSDEQIHEYNHDTSVLVSRKGSRDPQLELFRSSPSSPSHSSAHAVPHNPVLKRLHEKQLRVLHERAERRTPHAIRRNRSKGIHKALGVYENANNYKSLEDNWKIALSTIPAKFLCSSEARMEETSRIKNGSTGYKGLPISHLNSKDMLGMFNIGWKPKYDIGQPIGTYDQFRIVVGQYARFIVATRICKATKLVESGMVFKILCHLSAVEAFLRYFEIRASAGTVMNKAAHLIRLADFADAHFRSRKDENRRGILVPIVQYLQTVRKTFKTESRRLTSMRRVDEERAKMSKYLPESDYVEFSDHAVSTLEGLISHCKCLVRSEGIEKLSSFLDGNRKFVQKWCTNFLSALILHGGGQRPQVYAIMEAPSSVDLGKLAEEAKNSGAFQIKLSFEKRIRSLEVPNVLLPKNIFRAVKFHVLHVLPAIARKFSFSENDPKRSCLVLHTETGDVLDSSQVTKTIQKFLKRLDPELGNVTSMSLRASYASMMLTRFRRGETIGNYSEHEFLEYLSNIMNTSVEQLKETYLSLGNKNFHACAQIVSQIIDKNPRTGTLEREARRAMDAPDDLDLDLF